MSDFLPDLRYNQPCLCEYSPWFTFLHLADAFIQEQKQFVKETPILHPLKTPKNHQNGSAIHAHLPEGASIAASFQQEASVVAGFQQTSPVVTCFLYAAPVPAPFTTGSTHTHRLPTGSSSSTPYSTRSTHEFLSYREHTSLPISHRDQPRVLCPSGFSTSLFHSNQWQSLSRWDHLSAVITCAWK